MNSILYIDDNGKAELYDDDYNITIFCKDEQEQQRAMKRLEVANRMRWHPITKCDEHPKNNKPYIVSIKWASDSGKINTENAFAKYDAYEDCWILDDGDGTVFNADCDSYYSPLMNASITHWMEQPEDPEKTEEGDPE